MSLDINKIHISASAGLTQTVFGLMVYYAYVHTWCSFFTLFLFLSLHFLNNLDKNR